MKCTTVPWGGSGSDRTAMIQVPRSTVEYGITFFDAAVAETSLDG